MPRGLCNVCRKTPSCWQYPGARLTSLQFKQQAGVLVYQPSRLVEQPPVLPRETAQGIHVRNKDNLERLITEEYLAKRTLSTWQLYLGWQYDVSRSFHYEMMCAPSTPEDLWDVQKDAGNSKHWFMRKGPSGMLKTWRLRDMSLDSPDSDPVKGNTNAGTWMVRIQKATRGAPLSQRYLNF